MATVDNNGRVEELVLNPEELEEIGGMMFVGGVMVCGLPAEMERVSITSKEDFARKMSEYGVGVGRGAVSVLQGVDLQTFCGTFHKARIH